MNKLKLWTGIILVFLLGALAGSFGMGMYIKHKFTRLAFEDNEEGPPPPPLTYFLMRKLEKDLELTDDQTQEIKKIMDDAKEDFHRIRQEYHPEMRAIVERSFERIREKLNPEQRARLDRLHREIEERWHHRRGFPRSFVFGNVEEIFSRLKGQLKLNESQLERVFPIIEDDFEKRQEVIERYRKQRRTSAQEMRKEMLDLQQTTEKQLEKVLTVEQMNVYRKMCEMHGLYNQKRMRPQRTHGLGRPLN